jgi:hypothetical protein
MRGENRRQAARVAGGLLVLLAALTVGACSSTSLDNILKSSERNATPVPATAPAEGIPPSLAAAANNDTPCPEVKVRTGAATLMVGNNPRATGEPSPLDVRYQGSIVNTARECHLNAGILTVKVGVEGRVITGPAGGPGSLTVPLRIAVVHEGIAPKTVVSKFASIPVTIANAVDRVTFTHVDPDVSFPMPRPASVLDSYVVYVGFDPQGEQPKKPVRKRRR